MSRLRIAPIVEGHGEYEAIRTLLWRIWVDLIGGEHVEVIRPIRKPRSKLVKKEELGRAVELAVAKLRVGTVCADHALVLVLVDADKDPPCRLGPCLLQYAKDARSDADVCCVVANVEYETWFVAGAESLADYLNLPSPQDIPLSPEELGVGKSWVEKYFRGTRYSETIDQPRMTAKLDLEQCRSRSPSFDKLCRELEKRLASTS
ncbi:MAG: DUF4276 family protein [Phycisphaerae bacterium]